jgi:hypothetical protein
MNVPRATHPRSWNILSEAERGVHGGVNQFHGAQSSTGNQHPNSKSRNTLPSVELEMSSPCSHKPATGPYAEPDQSNPRPPMHHP